MSALGVKDLEQDRPVRNGYFLSPRVQVLSPRVQVLSPSGYLLSSSSMGALAELQMSGSGALKLGFGGSGLQ